MSGITEVKKLIKQQVKKKLTVRQQRKYYKLLDRMTVTYDAWIRETEEKQGNSNIDNEQVKRVPYEACKSYLTGNSLQTETAEVILFSEGGGEISGFAEKLVAEYFDKHKEIKLLYGDEDVAGSDGVRYTPWLKPDWSPDTFLSFFYFGSIFAVRTEALRSLNAAQKEWIWQENGREEEKETRAEIYQGIYRLCYVLAKKSGGFEKRSAGDIFSFPVGHVDEILYHSRFNREMELTGESRIMGIGNLLSVKEEMDRAEAPRGKVSVILLSKDHPEILKRCIRSIKKNTKKQPENHTPDYEIIVVDNGSGEEVKRELTGWLAENGAAYIYERMPFNFSAMCNKGAQAAAGNVLLFMNDDVEVIGREGAEAGFLRAMYECAVSPYTGAVGAKLYYPESIRIQHAGIVNQQLGPVHKLQFIEDAVTYCYGFNRRKRNVIAVTGACLAVERDKFVSAGGFPEKLPVAFNDVDLCFSLFEKGYYNVVLQDIILYHHESLSRGNDDEREKLNRLLEEKNRLYERHPRLYAKDPFYHKYYAADILNTGFDLKADYAGANEAVSRGKKVNKAVECRGILDNARQDACVMISLEYAGHEKGAYLIQGYSFVAGSDNACYEKFIILRQENHTEALLCVKPEIMPRKDVENNLPDQVNVGLAGFRTHIGDGELAAGVYRIGILVKDRCTGAKLYAWTNRYLHAE